LCVCVGVVYVECVGVVFPTAHQVPSCTWSTQHSCPSSASSPPVYINTGFHPTHRQIVKSPRMVSVCNQPTKYLRFQALFTCPAPNSVSPLPQDPCLSPALPACLSPALPACPTCLPVCLLPACPSLHQSLWLRSSPVLCK